MRRQALFLIAVVLASLTMSSTSARAEVYFNDCDAARAAGAAPMFAWQASVTGYRTMLDTDNDGVACESGADDLPGRWRRPGEPIPETPIPVGVPTDIVRYPWAPAIFAVSYTSPAWTWTPLSLNSWAALGYPSPRVAGWIEGTTVFKYSTADTIFAVLGGTVHALTYGEWEAMSLRPPNAVVGGYVSLSWYPAGIAFTNEQFSLPMTFDRWERAGYPMSQARGILPGDYVCAVPHSATLYYQGATVAAHALTFEEWAATGFSTPRQCPPSSFPTGG